MAVHAKNLLRDDDAAARLSLGVHAIGGKLVSIGGGKPERL
jgi:hypothetical protein